jgi:phage regulator Rha-like protein
MIMNEIVNFKEVENNIIKLRGIDVIIDADVAKLYGVETKRINEAVKNNPDKFPKGYILKLSNEEWKSMKTKISSSLSAGGKVKLPNAFTEKGLYMLATILKSDKATNTTIAIVETFAKLRDLSRTVGELSTIPDKEKQKNLMQKSGDIISELLGEDLQTTETESEIELNFAVLKFKHTIKRKGK